MAKDFDSYELRVVKGVPYYGGVISGHFYPIGLGVWVDHVIETFDTSEFTMKISYRISESNEEIRSCIFSSKEMSLKGYVHYNSLGVDVTYRTQQLFEAYINSERRKATEYIYNHKFLGWCRHNNLLIYRHQTATIGKKTSTYTGDFEIAPKGTYRAWINGVKKHILGHYPLEAALVIGLSAVTVGYFSQTGQPRNLMFHIAGNSSTGKSTASMLAISTTGSPEINQNQSRSLMKTWNTTENAIYGLLRGNHGAVLCLDEMGVRTQKNIGQIIYKLSAGIDKERLDKDAKLTKDTQPSWSTTIISTGEIPLANLMKDKADGVMMRCFEFSNLKTIVWNPDTKKWTIKSTKWTKSAQNAENIQRFVRENYGHAAPKLAQYILKLDKEKPGTIQKAYEECCQFYRERRNMDDGFTDRKAEFLGFVLLTARLIKAGLGLSINWKTIAKFFIVNEREQKPEYLQAYEAIQNLYVTNKQCFWNSGEPDQKLSSFWGTIQKKNSKIPENGKTVTYEIAFLTDILKRELQKCGFPNADRVLRQLKKYGYLSYDGDRLTRKRSDPRNSDIKLLYYVIRTFEDK